MKTNENETAASIEALMRNAAIRGTVAVGLLGVALIHVIDGIGKYSETRYLFWMFMGLVVSSIAVALAVLFTRSRTALVAAAGLTATALAGYVLSRTTGLPSASDDVGNWTETIGVANVFIESAVVVIATSALFRHQEQEATVPVASPETALA